MIRTQYPLDRRRLTSAIDTRFVSSFFDKAVESMLGSQSLPHTQTDDQATTLNPPADVKPQSPTASVKSKGFGSESSDKRKGLNKASASSITRKKKVGSEATPASLVRAVGERMAAANVSRAASLEIAQGMDELLEGLVAPIPPKSSPVDESPAALPAMPLLSGVFQQLDRLAGAGGISSSLHLDAGPAKNSADSSPAPGSIRVTSDPAPPSSPSQTADVSSMQLTAMDLLEDLEELLASEESDVRQHADLRKPFVSSMTAGDAGDHQRRRERPGPAPAEVTDGKQGLPEERYERQSAQVVSDLNQRLKDSQLAAEAASAETARVSVALAAREASSLKAAGLAGSVMARLMASEALSNGDKVFFSQALSQMMAVLLEPPPTVGDKKDDGSIS